MPWVHPEEILSYFSKVVPSLSYENFVMQSDEVNVVSGLTLEDNQGLPL